MKKIRTKIFSATGVIAAAALLAACNSTYKNADLTVVDFPTYDSTRFTPLDKPSGKLFDILTNKTTGLNFSNDVPLNL